jgi:hypothetical protein
MLAWALIMLNLLRALLLQSERISERIDRYGRECFWWLLAV